MASYQPQSATLRLLMEGERREKPKSRTLQAIVSPPAAPEPAASKTESAARGALQGATLGYGEEASAALGAAGQAMFGNDPESLGDIYRRYRDDERAANEAAQQANPKTYLAGQVTGGVATAAAGGAPATIGKTALMGAGYGAAAGLGDSKADLTKGEIGEAAIDTAIGAGVGGVAGALGHAIVRGGGAATRAAATQYGKIPEKIAGIPTFSEGVAKWAARPRTAVTSKLGKDFAGRADEVSELGRNATTGQRLAETEALEGRMSEKLGEKVEFSPAEATGDPALALRESAAEQMPKTMSPAQLARTERLRNGAKYLDSMVDHIAADPSKLGKEAMADSFSGNVERHLGNILEEASAETGPKYAAFDAMIGAKRVVPTDNARSAAEGLLEEYRTNPALVKHVRQLVDQIDEFGSKTNRITGNDFQKLRSSWLKRARGDIQQGLGEERLVGREKARIERAILDAFEADAALAEKGIASKEAIGIWREANQTYRAAIEEYERVATDSIVKLADIAGGEAGDTMIAKLAGMQPEQLGGVFRVANKVNPDMASQMRAELFEQWLTKGGKPFRPDVAPVSHEVGAAVLKPGGVFSKMQAIEPQARAAFAGDNKALFAFKEAMLVSQRLATGPNLRGAQTAPLAAQVLGEAAETAARVTPGAPPQAPGAIRKLVDWVFTDDKATAQALSTRDGIETIRDAMKIALGEKPKKSAQEILDAAARLGLVPTASERAVQAPAERVGRMVR